MSKISMSKHSKSIRRSCILLPLVAATVLLSACSSGSAASNTKSSSANKAPIPFDAVLAQTGATGFAGSAGLDGIKAAIADVNSHGGVLGRKFELHYLDDQSLPANALSAAKQLQASYPSSILLAGSTTPEASAILPYSNTIPAISFCISTSATVVDPKVNPYTYSLFPSSAEQVNAFSATMKSLGKTKVGLLIGSDAGAQASIPVFAQTLSKYGLTQVGVQTASATQTDYTTALQALRNAGATGIIVNFPTSLPLVTAAKGIQQLGWTDVDVVGGPSADASAMSAIPESVTKQFYVTAPSLYLKDQQVADDTPRDVAFTKAMIKVNGGANLAIAASYADSVYLAAYAIKTAKSTDADKVQKALNGLKNKNITSQIVGIPNPRYSATVHTLDNGDFTHYWARLRPGPGPQYPGTLITVSKE